MKARSKIRKTTQVPAVQQSQVASTNRQRGQIELPRHDETGLKFALAAARQQAEKLTAQGLLDEALERRVDVVEFVSSLYGERSVDAVSALHEMGLLQYDLARYAEAEKTLQRAAFLYREGNIDDPKVLANILLGIGICKFALGLLDDALPLYQECTSILEKEFGRHYPGLVSGYVNSGLIFMARGDLQSALQVFKRAQRVSENVLGTDRLQLSDIHHNIGVCYDQLGQGNDALNSYKRAALIREKAHGDDDVNSASLYSNMANLLGEREQTLQEAIKYHLRALKIRERLLGESHMQTLTSRMEIGLMYARMGLKKEATKNLQQALQHENASQSDLFETAKRILRLLRSG